MQADTSELDQMPNADRVAVEEWMATIRHEEALASVNHSVAEMVERTLGEWLSTSEFDPKRTLRTRWTHPGFSP
jgi:hypothetical protein